MFPEEEQLLSTGHVSSSCMPAQSCLILCEPMDWRPQGSSVHLIFWRRMLDPPPGDLPHPGI